MILLDHAPFTPFMQPRTAHPPGLSPLDPAQWTVLMPDYAPQMAYREALIERRRPIVLAQTPPGRAAAQELLEMLLAHLLARGDHRREGGAIRRPDGVLVAPDADRPFETIGRLVAEDFCVLLPDPSCGEYRLAGAVLCFPARWLLTDKMERPMTAIHAPVPDYDGTMARRVNRVFEALRPGHPLVRGNWMVYPTGELHLPLDETHKAAHGLPAGDGLYLRTERQTLTRLPRSGAIAFGIKTSICPIEALSPAQAAGLHRAFAGIDAASIAYRSGAALYERTLATLAVLAS